MAGPLPFRQKSILYTLEQDCSDWCQDTARETAEKDSVVPGRFVSAERPEEIAAQSERLASKDARQELVLILNLPDDGMLARLHDVLKPFEKQGLKIDEVRPPSRR
jgi:hypothetical protein